MIATPNCESYQNRFQQVLGNLGSKFYILIVYPYVVQKLRAKMC